MAGGLPLSAQDREPVADEGGDDNDCDSHEDVTRGAEALGDLGPLPAELVADKGDGRAPDGAPGQGRRAEAHEAHLCQPGGNGDEGADDGQDASEEHRRFPAPSEPALCPVEIRMREKDIATELVDEGTASETAYRPAHERTEELSDDSENDHEGDVEPARRGEVAAIAERHLGRNRHAGGLGKGQEEERDIAPRRKEVFHSALLST